MGLIFVDNYIRMTNMMIERKTRNAEKTMKAFVFDFDDTLATTDCLVEVVFNGSVVRELTPAEFNTFELAEGESFGFNQFKSIINPVALPLTQLAIDVQSENHNVFILSARPVEATEAINGFLKSIGIQAKRIICVGGKPIDIAKAKRTVLMSIIENHEVVWFFDDDDKNIQQAENISNLNVRKV